jgi:hypothetical protein
MNRNRIYLREVELLNLDLRVVNLKCFKLLFVLDSLILLSLSFSRFSFDLNLSCSFLINLLDLRIAFNFYKLLRFLFSQYYRILDFKN